MDRRTTFCWIRDLLDHLRSCTEHWQTSAGLRVEIVWADATRRDIDELRRLCESLQSEYRRR